MVAIVVVVGVAGPARGKVNREEYEAQVADELATRDPDAVPLLEKAEAARRADDLAEARALYSELLERVPGFAHAQRRLCSVESMLGNHQRAIELCSEALAQTESPENLGAMGAAQLNAGNTGEAKKLARQATRIDRDASYAWSVLCAIAIEQDDFPALQRCSDRLLDLAPEELSSQTYGAIVAASEEDWDRARYHLERARKLGLPDDAYEGILSAIEEAEPTWPKVLKAGGIAVLVWIAVMILLVLLGAILSAWTMRAATRAAATDAREPVHAAGATLRGIYRTVLRVSCAVYYASMPLLLAIIVVTGGGLVIAMFSAGHVPVKAALIIIVITVVSAFAVLKSLFVRGDDSDPGMRLNPREHPRLRALLDEVAAKIRTRPVDNVYMTPGTDIAVLERGGMYRQLRGSTERCLILGVGVLEDMPLPALRAILAHEYGHFSNEDTAGGGLALAVRRSLMTMGISLAQSGAAAWYNPAWLFFRVFYRAFQGISQGASRLQEIMADRWAVLSYGARNFETGLRHAIRRSILFDRHVGATLDEVIETQARLRNLYTYRPKQAIDDSDVDELVEAAVNEERSTYDSHPRPADRFRWAHAMRAPEPPDDSVGADAWSLFDDREALQCQMTHEVRANVARNYGVAIAGDPGTPEEGGAPWL